MIAQLPPLAGVAPMPQNTLGVLLGVGLYADMATVPVPDPVYCIVTVVLFVGPAAMVKPVLAVEVVITLMDFVEEDMSRKLPASERINHTLLAINYGAILILLAVLVGPGGVSLLS